MTAGARPPPRFGSRTALDGQTAARVLVAVAGLGLLVSSWALAPVYVLAGCLGAVALALVLRYPIIGFCLLAFSVPWASGTSIPIGGFPVTFTDLLVAVVGVAWIADAAWNRRNPLSTAVWTPYLLGFLAAIILSATQAADSHAALRELVKWLELAVVYFATVRFVRSDRDVQVIVAALILAAVAQSILGFAQSGLQLGPAAFVRGSILRAYGTFDQPNPYAGYLNLCLPLSLALTFRGSTARQRLTYGGATILILGALFASGSRGAFIAAAVAILVVMGLTFVFWRRLAWLGLLGVVLAGWLTALGPLSLNPLNRVLDAVGLGGVAFGHVTDANFSTVERAAHWLAGVRMFAAHPLLGVGIGNYAVAYPAYHPRGWYAPLAHAHDYYINIAAEAGVLGLVTYVLLAGSALWYSYAALTRWRGTSRFPVAVGVFGALIATNIHNLFDVLYVHGTLALLALMMGLVAVSLSRSPQAGGPAVRSALP